MDPKINIEDANKIRGAMRVIRKIKDQLVEEHCEPEHVDNLMREFLEFYLGY